MLIDIYIGILLWLLVNGLCMIIGYYIGRGSVWSEINPNGGVTKEDGEDLDLDEVYKKPEWDMTANHNEIILSDGKSRLKITPDGMFIDKGTTGKWEFIEYSDLGKGDVYEVGSRDR